MKIKESGDIAYDKLPWFGPDEGYEKFDPKLCLLEKFSRTNDKLTLFFKNGSQAVIRAKNITGGREVDLIEKKLNDLLEKSYEEILNANF